MRGLAFAIATCYDATLNEGTPIIMRMHWLRNILRERGFASPDVAFQISANASDSGTHEEDLVSSGEEEGHGGEGEETLEEGDRSAVEEDEDGEMMEAKKCRVQDES